MRRERNLIELLSPQKDPLKDGARASSLHRSPPRPTPRMGSKTPKATRPVGITPQDLPVIGEILDHLVRFRPPVSPSMRSRVEIVDSCRRHSFHTVDLTSGRMDRRFNTFPVPEESPAHHVRPYASHSKGSTGFPRGFSNTRRSSRMCEKFLCRERDIVRGPGDLRFGGYQNL